MTRTFRNPIIPGFYPDPSICRVGEDYYLVTSTFEYFPGLPIFHSRDLVHWRQIGHVLDRPSQLPLDGVPPSGGLYAPTIRYRDGTFYVINTLVAGTKERGNFIVTASDPAGPWSEPYWLGEEAPGIDPSLFFDDDGRAWYCGNRPPPGGGQYEGHREIWLQELDLSAMRLTGPTYSLWDGALKGNLHCEAPHLYKINGLYYLMVAEAGTEHNHAVTIARSDKITGPYVGNPRNPILTHRHLGLDHPIVGTGHADLVQTQNGEWWMVCLAMRPYDGYFFNLGRETFMTPVRWEESWPIVSPGIGRVEFEYLAPNLPEHRWPSKPVCDQFESPKLDLCWNFLRTPRDSLFSLTERPGYLRLKLRPHTLSEWVNPSFVGRRQQHIHFAARAAMEFTPHAEDECAGLVLMQNSNYHFRLVITQCVDGLVARLIKRQGTANQIRYRFQQDGGTDSVLAELPVQARRIYFKVEAHGQAYSFYVADALDAWHPLAEKVDGRILSTPVADGFVGAYIGMYASSNGKPSDNVADFDWFEYTEIRP
ncbi:MAG: glycoside hydrolase family 43 protein [Anaerolineae bacterium]|nr:glycoside hydrolase family 43 protein [Anaerolineae bacterium]